MVSDVQSSADDAAQAVVASAERHGGLYNLFTTLTPKSKHLDMTLVRIVKHAFHKLGVDLK